MRKLFLLIAIGAAGFVSAFPFRTSCGKVVSVSDAGIKDMEYGQVLNTLKLINGDVCGTTNVSITIYNH